MAGPLPTEVVEAVTRLADNSPFMASAVLRGLVESGNLVPEREGWHITRPILDEVQSCQRAATFLARCLELLPPDTLQLLSTGAVIGKEFSLDIAASLARQTPQQALAALQIARQRHLVWVRSDASRCVFVHDKVRSTLLDRHPEQERRSLHTLVARYLQRHDPSRAADVAYHFDAAGDSRSALPFALQAAEKARAQYAFDVAEQQYLIAERGSQTGSAATRYRIAQGLGEVLMLRGRYDAAGAKLEAAAAMADGTLAKAQIRGKLGELAFRRGDMEQAIEGFEMALRVMGRYVPGRWPMLLLLVLCEALIQALHTVFPSVFVRRIRREPNEHEKLVLRLLSNLAHGCWYCRSKVHVMWAHLRGMNLAERFQPSAEMAQCYAEHAPGLTLLGYLSRAEAYARKSLEIRHQLGDLWGQGQSLHYWGVVLYAGARYPQCIEMCREAIRLLERTGDYWQVHIARYQIAASLLRLGNADAALQEAQLNHKSGIELGDEQTSAISLDIWARAAHGMVPEEILEREVQRPQRDVQGRAQVLFAQALCLARKGEFTQATEILQRAIDDADSAGISNAYTLPYRPWLATILRWQAVQLRQHTPDRRSQLLRRAETVVRQAIRRSWLCRNDLPHAPARAGADSGHAGLRPPRAPLAATQPDARRGTGRALGIGADATGDLPTGTRTRLARCGDKPRRGAEPVGRTPCIRGQFTRRVTDGTAGNPFAFRSLRQCARLGPTHRLRPLARADLRTGSLGGAAAAGAEHCLVLQRVGHGDDTQFVPVAGSLPGAGIDRCSWKQSVHGAHLHLSKSHPTRRPTPPRPASSL